MLLIRRLAVEREHWLTAREFGEAFALSQLSPGIHLVALAGLIGQRVAGWRGVGASVAGMMIPAALITTALTAAYGLIAAAPLAQAALSGIAPVTAGMTIATAGLLVRAAARRGAPHLALDIAVATAALAAAFLFAVPTIGAIAAGALVGAVALGGERPTSRAAPMG